ncbi:alpha/beta hydrolase [Granulosicoccaceae sp. 1_MG-2023]|nr:alpha/beta hydrolase [Granulosicoccaceae sp. 1_MG-2023]
MTLKVDGHVVNALDVGAPEAPVLILVHGAGLDQTFWRYIPRALAAGGLRVIAPDLPAHGRSGGVLLQDIESMAAWVGRLAQALGAGRYALAGHSMGSLVALQAAADAGAACRALALIGNAYPMQVAPPLLEAAAQGDPLIHSLTTFYGTSRTSRLHGAFPAGSSLVNLRLSQQYHERPGVLHNDLLACNRYRNGETAAQALRAPVLFVSGDEDCMTPARATQTLAGLLPDAQRVVLPRCAHQHSFEQPQGLIDALGGFFGEAP